MVPISFLKESLILDSISWGVNVSQMELLIKYRENIRSMNSKFENNLQNKF